MKTDVKVISPSKRELVIDVPWVELKDLYADFLKKFSARVQMPGFRKGRVPLGMVERQYGGHVELDFLKEHFNMFYYQALQKAKLNPVGEPEVKDLDFQKGQPMHLHVALEILPELNIPAYKEGYKVEKPVFAVQKDDVEKQIDELRKKHATLKDKEDPAEMGDHLEAEVVETDADGNSLPESQPETTTLVIGENPITGERAEALAGIRPDETRRIEFKAEQKGEENHNFNIKALKIQTPERPKLDKEFVQTVDPELDTPAQLKEKLSDELKKYFDKESEKMLESNIREYFISELKDFEIPPSIVDNYLGELYEQQKQQVNMPEEAFRKEYRDMAHNSLKWMMIREQIIKEEGFSAEDEEIQKKIDELLEKVDEKLRDTYRSYYESEKFRENIKSEFLTEKVMNHLKSFAKIKEKKISRKA